MPIKKVTTTTQTKSPGFTSNSDTLNGTLAPVRTLQLTADFVSYCKELKEHFYFKHTFSLSVGVNNSHPLLLGIWNNSQFFF